MMQTLLKAGGMVLILFCTTSIGMAPGGTAGSSGDHAGCI